MKTLLLLAVSGVVAAMTYVFWGSEGKIVLPSISSIPGVSASATSQIPSDFPVPSVSQTSAVASLSPTPSPAATSQSAMSSTPTPAATPTSGMPANVDRVYIDNTAGFQITYPAATFRLAENVEEEFSMSSYKGKLQGGKLVHTMGTRDISIGFFRLNKDFGSVKPLISWFVSGAKDVQIAGRQGVEMQQRDGANVIVYYGLPAKEGISLLIKMVYLDESTDSSLKTSAGFIPIAEQQTIFAKVISTLQFK